MMLYLIKKEFVLICKSFLGKLLDSLLDTITKEEHSANYEVHATTDGSKDDSNMGY